MGPLWLAVWTVFVLSHGVTSVEGDDSSKGADEIKNLERLDPSANLGPRPCGVPYKKIGCYKDKRKKSSRAMSELLFQDRYKGKGFSGQKVDWKNWDTYLPELVCRCARAAVAKGYTFFGIQFYGECWSSGDAGRRFHIYGEKDGDCVDTSFQGCDNSNNIQCTGKENRNYMYEIVEEAESGNGQTVNPDE